MLAASNHVRKINIFVLVVEETFADFVVPGTNLPSLEALEVNLNEPLLALSAPPIDSQIPNTLRSWSADKLAVQVKVRLAKYTISVGSIQLASS